MTRTFLLSAVAAACFATPVVAVASTSHKGWPEIDGVLWINKQDDHATKHGTGRSDELLGGHGNDVLHGEGEKDVLWGDYKPSGQPGAQWDHLYGGDGRDFIYASHGRNTIDAGAGDDYVKAHFGRGRVDCGPGNDLLYISRRAQKRYTIRNCETVSHRSLGY